MKNTAAFFIALAFSAAPAMSQQDESTAPLAGETPIETPADPVWKICNETSFSLRLATVTAKDGALKPEGWTPLVSGSCIDKTVTPKTPRFVYAESSPAHRGGIREWKGRSEFCASDEDFVAEAGKSCALQNMYTRTFLAIDPEEKVTTFVEIEEFGKNAATAGIQRLLQDNGFEITRIDGVAGRRTVRTLNKFLKENDLSSSISTEEQLQALERAALEKTSTIGLNICNKSSAPVWTAMARRRKGNWESKGWWQILPNNCGQVFTESLINNELFYYAIQDGIIDENGERSSEKVLRTISTKPSQFCISDSRFSVIGRDNCSDLGYSPANFRTLPIDKESLTIDLTDADFASKTVTGLRQ